MLTLPGADAADTNQNRAVSVIVSANTTSAGTLTLTGTTTDALSYTNVDAVEINAASVGSTTAIVAICVTYWE